MGQTLSTPGENHVYTVKTVFDRSIKHLYDSRPMSGGLPIQIDPLDLAKNQIHLRDAYGISEMPRLAEYSPSDQALIQVDLHFRPEGDTGAKLSGEITTELKLRCERCLGSLMLPLTIRPVIFFEASAVDSSDKQSVGEEESDLRDIIALDGPVDLKDLVEEEILLAIPMIPKHDSEECNAGKLLQQKNDVTQRATNPFSKLAELKKDQ